MELTPNLQLKKPAGSDRAKQIPFNENSDILDQLIGGADMGTEATSITGAIAEHSAAISGIEGAGYAKSVNNVAADSSGNIELTRVLYADNLVADDAQSSSGTFVERTTGGEASLSDGDAWLTQIRGNRIHENYVPETLNMTVTMTPRIAPSPITAEIDNEAYIAEVGTAGTTYFAYTAGAWNLNPATYGITVSNDPVNGDAITVIWDGEEDPEMTVNAVPRVAPSAMTATVDHDTFVAYVNSDANLNFTYNGSAWSANLALYGITVTGDCLSGDAIAITYVKEVRGTIYVTAPTKFTSTGWNLYNHTKTYARVLKYHETYGFGVKGTYTKLQFSATESGEKSDITVTDGKFSVPSDGYVWVTGGNNTDTAIWMTWSDWNPGSEASYVAYTESTLDGTDIMSNFPNGLCQVGNVRDIVDFSIRLATSNIERMAYNAANLAAAKASGRDYEYDENYIYIVRETPITYKISSSFDPTYQASDHGMEFFSGTTVPCFASMLYGQNLKDKLRTDVVTKSSDLVDNLASEDTKKALTAKQGKALNTRITNEVSAINTVTDKIKADAIADGAGAHNAIYRGKNLGTSVTSDQWTAISNGKFTDLFIGDYWVINSITWRIAGFDYWLNNGDAACATHHIVIMPDENLLVADGSTTHWLHHENVTSGAYVGTDFYAGTNNNTGKATCRTKAQNAFGSTHILSHREYLKNAASGYETAGAWYDSDIEIPTEQMVYGCKVFGNCLNQGNVPASYTIDNAQLPLFALDHSKICNRAGWWFRDVASASSFAVVGNHGSASSNDASNAWVGVRPAFGIK